jgi:prepilin-type N-terminal cleavage/methylation domain-containing protein
MNYIQRKQSGFTAIEMIISIFILSIGIVGVFNAFSIVNILTSDTTDRLTATYLAQEGMEIARNIRDINWLKMDYCSENPESLECTTFPAWDDNLAALGTCNSSGCEADYTSEAMSGTSGNYFYLDSNGFYNYNTGGTKTKFQRKILITYGTDSDGNTVNYIMDVVVQVSWDAKATVLNSSGFSASSCTDGKNCVITKETLYDWYYNYNPAT